MPNNLPKLMRTRSRYLGAVLILCFCTLLSEQAICQSTSSSPASQTSPNGSRVRHRPKGFLVPYHGTISAVDKDAKTFTIEGRRKSRVLKMIDGTSITKGGETATIDDFNKDDEVSGSYLKDADGTLVARTIKIGPIKRKAIPTPTATPRR
jgi:hypothetical protein